MHPNLNEAWIRTRNLVPSEFFAWTVEQKLSIMNPALHQKFYTLCWTYHKRFKSWPPKELWEIILEKAKDERKQKMSELAKKSL